MKTTVIILATILYSFQLFSQTKYPTRDSIHIFWQPDNKITYQDFKQVLPQNILNLMDTLKFDASASVGILRAIDFPKRARVGSHKLEKIYFAPAFDRITSGTRTHDSLQIAIQASYLDIAEICSRWGREQFNIIRDSANTIGSQADAYCSVVSEMMKKFEFMRNAYTNDVIINRKIDAFEIWRKKIDSMLLEQKQWSTTSEDCYRIIKGKPIEPGYKKSN